MMDAAYNWVCHQRRDSGHNNSIWDLRYNWASLKPQLQHQLRTGTYTLSALKSSCIKGEWLSSWSALDALVLKALSLTLQPLFTPEQYSHCTHLKDAGGIHAALKQVSINQDHYQHILKSDAYHYYESIDHQVLLAELETHVSCPIILNLVSQYCQRLEIKDGHYYHFQRGIPKGCPLSPLMAALYLKPLDDVLCKHGFYVRFMDDWVIMVKSKHQLRKVVKLTHKILSSLKLKIHPDKTYIGRIKKGFDFLGVHFGAIPEIAKASLEKHRTKLAQRYAQGASTACIGDYVARWTSWCRSVLRASGAHHNKTNPLEHCWPYLQWPEGSLAKEKRDEKIIKTTHAGAAVGCGLA
tara:strand:- start:58 stop:1116 length:1059 start_codon:yes stop_codon:yes gene_type:complete